MNSFVAFVQYDPLFDLLGDLYGIIVHIDPLIKKKIELYYQSNDMVCVNLFHDTDY